MRRAQPWKTIRARALRGNATSADAKLWSALRNRRLDPPEQAAADGDRVERGLRHMPCAIQGLATMVGRHTFINGHGWNKVSSPVNRAGLPTTGQRRVDHGTPMSGLLFPGACCGQFRAGPPHDWRS